MRSRSLPSLSEPLRRRIDIAFHEEPAVPLKPDRAFAA
jgi:hypothetical protein